MIASKRKQPARGPVALLKMSDDATADLRRALELSGGLEGLSPSDTVLVKPNLVGLSSRFKSPPFGVVTTVRLIEALCGLLRDHGCGKIAVGDGGMEIEDAGTDTMTTMEMMGLPKIAKHYGLELVDLNQGEFREVDAGGLTLRISTRALDTDFLISLPVLKTHCQTVLSLSLKNLKGCLHHKSKIACHDAGCHLSHHVALQARALYPDLAIIDGRYALARGPLHFGKPRRADLLIASRDALDADMVGAEVLGYAPGQVPHLAGMCKLLERECQAAEPLGGVALEDVRLNLPWDFEWKDKFTPEPFERFGVKGFYLPKYDASLCTGCSFLYSPAMVMISAAAMKKPDLGGVELLTGKNTEPSGKAKASVLLGNCIIKAQRKNPAIKKAVLVPGCPASLEDVAQALREVGVPASVQAYEWFMNNLQGAYPEEKGFLSSDYLPEDLY